MKQAPQAGTTGRVLLRTQNGSSGPYRAFNFVFAGILAIVTALAVFYNPNTFIQYEWWALLVAAMAGGLVFVLLNMLLAGLGKTGKGIEITLVVFLFALLIAAQVFVGWQLRLDVGESPWDFDVVYLAAKEYVLNGIKPGEYFEQFPGNIGLYSLLCLWFGAFNQMGMSDFVIPALALNIICVDLAILFLYLSARLMMGSGKAVFILVAAVFTVPFILYMPIAYTDTVSMPFPIAAVYLWLRARQHWRKGDVSGTMSRFIGLSVLVAIGGLLKMTVLIVYIAILIDLMLMLVGSARWLVLLAGAACFAVMFFGLGWLLRHSALLPSYNYGNGIPFTHWVMMGLQGNGGYNNDDYLATLNSGATKAARNTFALEQIQDRFTEHGALGTLNLFVDKIRYTWGDATYYAASKLDHRKVQEASVLYAYVVPTGARFAWLAYGAFAVHGAMLAGMVVGAIKGVLRKNDALTFVRIAVFGLFLFLLLWETRSRYLVNYLPLMLLVAMEALPMPAPARPAKGEKGKAPAEKEKAVAKNKNTNKAKGGKSAGSGNTEENAEVHPSAHLTAEAAPETAHPENLFDQPKKAATVETTTIHTQLFDVPTGDPFYEMAHTASWQVSEVLEVDAGAGEDTFKEVVMPEGQAHEQPGELPDGLPDIGEAAVASVEESPLLAALAEEPARQEAEARPDEQSSEAEPMFAQPVLSAAVDEAPAEPLETPPSLDDPRPDEDLSELFSLIAEVTPEMPSRAEENTSAQAEEDTSAQSEENTMPEPLAQHSQPNLNDAFTRAAFSALRGENEGNAPDDLFAELGQALEDGEANGPAPLPPAGRTPADLASEAVPGEEDEQPFKTNEPAPLESLWDFDDGPAK